MPVDSRIKVVRLGPIVAFADLFAINKHPAFVIHATNGKRGTTALQGTFRKLKRGTKNRGFVGFELRSFLFIKLYLLPVAVVEIAFDFCTAVGIAGGIDHVHSP